MKQLLFFLLLLAVPKCGYAQTAKALWCGDQTTLVFVYDDNNYAAGSTVTTHGETYTVTESYALTPFKPAWVNGGEEPTTPVQDNTTKVVFHESYDTARPTTTAQWFEAFVNLTEVVGIEYLHTDEVTSMEKMFGGCNNLEELDVSRWNTSKVTNMGSLFSSCKKLKTLDVSKDESNPDKWNTQYVRTLFRTFMNCYALENLDVSGWKTDNVTNMQSTFDGCQELKKLDVSEWNTENVIDMLATFRNCKKVDALDVSNWNTDNVRNMSHLFEECTVSELDVSKWNRSGKLTNLHWTFKNCKNVEELNVSGWNTENVTDMQQLFCGCSKLTELPVSNWKTGSLKDFGRTFMGCIGLEKLDLSNWDASNVTTMEHTFSGCKGLTELIVSGDNWHTDNLTNMSCTFLNCSKLSTIDISRWNTANVRTMEQTFRVCTGLNSLDLSRWNTENVTNMASIFDGCSGLTSLDVKNFNTQKVTKMYDMFKTCSNLTHLTFGQGFSTESIGVYQKTSDTDQYARYDGCPQFWGMFSACPKLRYIDFYDSDDIDAIKSVDRNTFSDMFSGVRRTTVIYLPMRSSSVTDVENVVYTLGIDPTVGGGGHGGGAPWLKCPNYYSADKVDIELPHRFSTNRAEYSRTMSNNYGSVILPYAFTTNDDIQAYTLDDEHPETMYFRDTETVPAHTPFAFKKLGNAEFIMEDATGGFGITVEATRSTNAGEDTWTGSKGTPYTHSENLGGWTTKGYYVNETVDDFDGTFYIAGDKFYKADGALTMYPHRVTFHGTWTKGTPSQDNNGAKFFNISMGESEVITAIEEAALRKDMREAESIHDMQGRKVSSLQRGLNIVRMSDGTVRKLLRR